MNATTVVNNLLEYGYDEPLWKPTMPTGQNLDPKRLAAVAGIKMVQAISELLRSKVSSDGAFTLIQAALEQHRRSLSQSKMPGPEAIAATLVMARNVSGEQPE